MYSKRLFCIIFFFFSIAFFVHGQLSLTVAKDGSGNFKNIQDAINSLPDDDQIKKIHIKNGIYNETIFIDKNNIKLIGAKKPAFGKGWEEVSQKLKKSVNGVFIVGSICREIWRCDHNDDWGAAPVNIRANDISLCNITVANTYGFDLKEEFDFVCKGVVNKIRRDGHQFALRTMPPTQRLTVDRCNFYSYGGDTVSPWDVENGTYVFTNCTMEGAVDFYCPRGWAYAENIHFICHNKNAAIWHDGREYEDSKSVIKNSTFVGEPGFKLGRYHRDAWIYLIDCKFSEDMADAPIYHVNRDSLQWGHRIYYYNCKKKGTAFSWYKNNIEESKIDLISKQSILQDRWHNPIPYTKNFEYPIPGNNKLGSIEIKDPKAERMLISQRDCGGWPKTLDGKTQPPPYDSEWNETVNKKILEDKKLSDATIDNGATVREIKYLLEAYNKTKNSTYLSSAESGIKYLLEMQYPNGGFPQFYPSNKGYPGHITYNDDAMINALEVLNLASKGEGNYVNISDGIKNASKDAVDKGILCILNTQIKQKDRKTIWAAQYDKETLLPAKARAYEHPSFASKESVAIIEFLMKVENPTEDIKNAIVAGVHFLHDIKLEGTKYTKSYNKEEKKFDDTILTQDNGAKPIWARFYDLGSNIPIFSGRDGVIKYDIFEIEEERRRGYGWYGYWAEDLIEKKYPRWYKNHFPVISSGLTHTKDTSYNEKKAFSDAIKTNPLATLPKVSKVDIMVNKDITYIKSGLTMDVYYKNTATKKIPILIIHGGGWRSGDKSMMQNMAMALANLGYACFVPEYTLSTHGLYPSPIQDLRSGIEFINEQSDRLKLDMTKLTIMGHSAGGQLASLLANTQNVNKFDGKKVLVNEKISITALIDLDGVIAFYHMDAKEGDDSKKLSASTLWFGAAKWDRYDLFYEASALTHVSKNTPPTLFMASKEKRMRAGWYDYAQKLDEMGITQEYYEFENAPHNFIYFEPWFTPMISKIDMFLQNIFKK